MSGTEHRGTTPPTLEGGGTWIAAPRARDLSLEPGALFLALAKDGASMDRLRGIDRVEHAARRVTLFRLKSNYARGDVDKHARRRFLHAFLDIMRQGEFRALDADTYARATDQRFLVDIPVRVLWDALDDSWLQEAREDPELAAALDQLDAPEAFSGRALFFYRGFRPLEVRGWYIAAKLDLVLAGLLGAITAPLRRLFGRGAEPPPPVQSDRWFRRVGLSDTPWYAGLLRPATLHEPCFRQVALLYRPVTEDDEAPAPLVLKLFRDIPLADAEMVFPERKLGIRTLDAVLMLGTAAAAGPAIVKAAASGGGTAIALATVLGGYAVKLVGQYLRKRRQHRARLTATLYDKSQDTDVGVLQFLVDAGQTQSTSEVAMAFHHLTVGGPATAEALDARIEGWLRERFEVDPDYDVVDALARASALGLVRSVGGGVYAAVDDGAAARAIDERWQMLGTSG